MEEKSLISCENIKQEPAVEFVLLLPTFHEDLKVEKKLIRDVKTEKCYSYSEESIDANFRVKSIQRSREGSETLICDLCGKTLEKKEKLRRHLFSHIKPFKCDCGKSFNSKPHLNQHKLTHDEDRTRFSCNFCSSTSYNSKRALDYHIKTYHFTIEENFKCDECDYEGKTRNNLTRHQRSHQKPFKCNKCDKKFSKNDRLKNHVKKHDEIDANFRVKSIQRSRKGSETFICDLCGKTLEKKEKLRRHLFSHIKPFKCDCGKSFDSKSHLNRHKSTHDEDRTKFKCIFCSSTSYNSKRALDYHIKNYHFTIGENFKCEECDYEGRTRKNLTRHQMSHQKPFKCNKCNKRFSVNQLLKNHLKKHDEPDEFVCLCSKVFKSSQALNYHKAMMHKAGEPIEIDDGTYTCNICHKIFGRRDHLKRHLLTHEEKKKCPICFKMFTVLSLKDHIRRHQLKEGEKQFECQKCSKTFFTSQDWKQHLKLHDKPFECDICGHRVALKRYLLDHVLRHVTP